MMLEPDYRYWPVRRTYSRQRTITFQYHTTTNIASSIGDDIIIIEPARMWHWSFIVALLSFTITVTTTGKMHGANAAFVSTFPQSHQHRPQIQSTVTPLSLTLWKRRPTMRATVVCLGRKVTVRIVGRKQGGEEWLEDACEMYLQRLKPTGWEVHTEWYKNNEALLKVHQEQSSSSSSQSKYVPIVLLDPTGIRCTSESFSDKVYHWLQEGGSRLVFVIGGGKQQSLIVSRMWLMEVERTKTNTKYIY